MADLGVVETDKRMRDLSERLNEVYGQAYNKAVKNTESALKKLQDFRREMNTQKYANLDDEQKSNKLRYYATQHIRAEGVAENIADQLKHAGELSQNIIRGELGNMYALNYDFGNYSTIRQTGLDISFTQYDKNQIAVLVAEGESPFTKVAYKSLKLETTSDEAIRKLQNQLIIATVNGESQAQLIKRIRNVTNSSEKRAKRIAQTERTRVQTQARMQSIHEAERLGIEMNKQWVARLVRTRESHQHVHEEIVGANEAFSNGLRYPGEIGAPPAEVVNCFCYIKPMVKNVGPAMQAHRADMQAMSFDNYRKRLKSSQNIGLQSSTDGVIINIDTNITGASGAIPRSDMRRMVEHAELYYQEIRNRTSDIKSIAENTEFSAEEVQIVKNHIFFNQYDLGYEFPTSFDPDYDMAVSWQRLIEGKNIQEMDIVMLNHELMEYRLMSEKGLKYKEAHDITDKVYSYSKFSRELDRKEGIL